MSSSLRAEDSFTFSTLWSNQGCTGIFMTKFCVTWVNNMQSIFWNFLVLIWFKIKTVHLYLSTRIKLRECWCNHINLLIHFYLFNSLVITEKLFLHFEAISDTNWVLKFNTHINLFLLTFIYEISLDWNKILYKLFFCVTLDIFYSLNF